MKLFAFDFETFLIQPFLLAPPIVCMSVAIDDEPPEVLHIRDSRLRKLLVLALSTPGCMMVAHNAAFEAVCIMAQWPELTVPLFDKLDDGEYYDTATGERLISIGRGDHWKEFDLQSCLQRHSETRDITLDKANPWRVRYGELINTPVELWPESAYQYSLEDTCVRELYRAQVKNGAKYLHDNTARWETLPRGNRKVFVPGQTWAGVELTLTSCTGFPTDPVMAKQLERETVAKLAEYEAELKRVGMLVPKREKGQLKLVLKKEPAIKLLVSAYAAQGREPPRGELTPAMLVKAYKHIGMEVEFESDNGRKAKVRKDDIEEAVEAGVPKDLLQGNYKLDEESCLNAKHPLLLAYTKYAQANTLMSKVRRLQKPLIQTSYNPLVETGRTSSRQGDDPEPGEAWMQYGAQVQNLPRAGDEYEEDTQ